MIQANELRIGNLVEYPNWNRNDTPAYFKIRDIYTDDRKIGLTNGIIQIPSTKLDHIKPIPLTEEWALKLGFINTHDGNFHKGYDLAINYNGNHVISFVWNKVLDWYIKYNGDIYRRIKSVHQLQNLYFALTGQELKITNI
jgi:hypothetical protein